MPDSGVELIAAERQRQIEVEGWTPDHDADHGDFDLVKAAHSYVLASLEPKYWGLASGNVPVWWPWDEEWWKPSDDEIRNLVKAGALIAAAIDRLRGSP